MELDYNNIEAEKERIIESGTFGERMALMQFAQYIQERHIKGYTIKGSDMEKLEHAILTNSTPEERVKYIKWDCANHILDGAVKQMEITLHFYEACLYDQKNLILALDHLKLAENLGEQIKENGGTIDLGKANKGLVFPFKTILDKDVFIETQASIDEQMAKLSQKILNVLKNYKENSEAILMYYDKEGIGEWLPLWIVKLNAEMREDLIKRTGIPSSLIVKEYSEIKIRKKEVEDNVKYLTTAVNARMKKYY